MVGDEHGKQTCMQNVLMMSARIMLMSVNTLCLTPQSLHAHQRVTQKKGGVARSYAMRPRISAQTQYATSVRRAADSGLNIKNMADTKTANRLNPPMSAKSHFLQKKDENESVL